MRAMKYWNSSHRAWIDVPNPGNIHGQLGRSSEQPDLAESVPSYCKGV